MKKKNIPIIYENFVMIKDVQFKKKFNTEFFGVDIPIKPEAAEKFKGPDDEQSDKIETEPQEIQQEENGDAFFITEAAKIPTVKKSEEEPRERAILTQIANRYLRIYIYIFYIPLFIYGKNYRM